MLALSADGRHALVATKATDVAYPLALQGGTRRCTGSTCARRGHADHRPRGQGPGRGDPERRAERHRAGRGLRDQRVQRAGRLLRPQRRERRRLRLDRSRGLRRGRDRARRRHRGPVEGGIYRAGPLLPAEYDCRDFGGSGLKQCQGSVADGQPFDTETPGEKTFTVTATDGAATPDPSVNYRVVPVNHQLTLASRAAGTRHHGANGDSSAGPIAGDYVLFESAATDLGFPGGCAPCTGATW